MVAAAEEAGLELELDFPLPDSLPAGSGTALFVAGTCCHRGEPVRGLAIEVDGRRRRAAAVAMPRRDSRCYRGGFWSVVPIRPREGGEVVVRARVVAADGSELALELGRIDVASTSPRNAPVDAEIAICMATYEPDAALLRAQLDSIREQRGASWVCFVSDDCSSEERFAEIERLVGGDERFVVSRSDRRRGFYRNFERALAMVPPGPRFVALSDQDDRWHRDKLAVLRGAIGDAALAYGDLRVVDHDGTVIAPTYWTKRRNNDSNLLSLLFANTVTGSASLIRRDVVDLALPFPAAGAEQYHDHWLALVALSVGRLRYVDRPIQDYVQHGGAALGHATANIGSPVGRLRGAGVERLRAALIEWRFAYFDGCVRLELLAEALRERCRGRLRLRHRIALRRFGGAVASPLGLPWFALRPLRRLYGRNETLGAEDLLAKGLAWRYYMALRARLGSEGRLSHDARPPRRGPGAEELLHPRAARRPDAAAGR